MDNIIPQSDQFDALARVAGYSVTRMPEREAIDTLPRVFARGMQEEAAELEYIALDILVTREHAHDECVAWGDGRCFSEIDALGRIGR